MRTSLRAFVVTGLLWACVGVPTRCPAQLFVLDPPSSSLPAIPAVAGDILTPAVPLGPGPLPMPMVGLSAAALGLLPGDVIDAISYGNDAAPGPTLTFSVTRPSAGAPSPFTPAVFSEVLAVPPGIQPEAASDLFTALDPTCGVFPPFNTQIVDGNGLVLPGPPITCYPGFGMGLAEGLALPGPPFNDDVSAFDWSVPGVGLLGGIGFSLAPGSPTLTPGTNPLLLAGAGPGDILVSFPAAPPIPGSLFVFFPAVALGLIAGPPGCAPPACDDLDALSISFPAGTTVLFSIAPASPSLGACLWSSADVLGGGGPPFPPCAPPFLPAGAIGLIPADDVNALESFANPCPVFPGGDADGDGFGLCDNCPGTFNPSQDDIDGDGFGDSCDPCTDLDLDGFGNAGFPNACPVDLCPFAPGPNVDTDGDGFAAECDNCPLVANPTQADMDFDGAGNPCDPCPHIVAGLPGAMTLKKVLLGYGGSGPGGGDDKPKLIKAEFNTGAAFDPDTADNVHVTLRNSTTSATLFAASLAAGGFWTQPAPPKWKYLDAGATLGVKVAKLLEAPNGSMDYKFKMVGKNANIAGPLAPADDVVVAIEIENGGAGVCFQTVATTCSSTPTKDLCIP